MLLDILLEIHKKKLDEMISNNEEYKNILFESQKLDKYVINKTLLIN